MTPINVRPDSDSSIPARGSHPRHRPSITVAIAASLGGAIATSAGAIPASIPMVNPGFEDISGEFIFNEFTFGPPNGWSLHDPNNVTSLGDGPIFYLGTLMPFEPDPVGMPGVYGGFFAGAPEGQRVAIAFNFAGSDGQGEYGIVQALPAVLEPNSTYTLTVEVGNIASVTALNGQFFNLDGFPGYRVDLLAGGVIVAQDNNSLAGSIPDGEFDTSTVVLTTSRFHPQIGGPLAIRLVNLNILDATAPAADLEVDFDNVQLDASPATVLGDLNGDGLVDGADLGLLLGAWGTPGADLNGDGTTDGADIGALLAGWT